MAEATEEIQRRRQRSELDPEFFEHLAGLMNATPPSGDGRTVIVVAVPRPAHRLTVSLVGGTFRTVVAPTYQDYRVTAETVRRELAEGPLGGGATVELLRAPLKSLAVRLGVVEYGRNNLTYAEGLGSYHQLVGLLTDAPPAVEDSPAEAGAAAASPPGRTSSGGAWPPPLSQRCVGCDACVAACPTGALSADRFLIRAELCLTHQSDRVESDLRLPEGFDCVMGCLLCQEVCPANAGKLRYRDLRPALSEEETAGLLYAEECPPEVAAKLGEMGFPGYGKLIARNLRAVLEANGLI